MKFETSYSTSALGLAIAGTIAVALGSACGSGAGDVNSAGGASGSVQLGASGALSAGNANSELPNAGMGETSSGTPSAGSGGSSRPDDNGAGGPSASGAGTPGSVASGGGGAVGASGGGGDFAPGGSGGAQTAPAVAFEFARVTVTGVRDVGTPMAQSVLRLHNGGAAPVQVTGLPLAGANAALFKAMSPMTLPVTLAPAADLPITITMATTGAALPANPTNKDLGALSLTATLTAALSAGTTSANVYGLVAAQSNYEATLGQILTALGYSLNVGKAQNNWNSNTSMNAASLPGVEANTDEVAAKHFIKAGAGNVTLRLVARFSPKGPLPYGFYLTTTGCPAGCTTVGTMSNVPDAQTSDKARMVNPPMGAGTMTSFDPGAGAFGLWIYTDQKTQRYDTGNAANGDWDYSEDASNTPAGAHRFKSYPLKDAGGTSVANTYLVAVEEAGNGDYQDYVFVLGNVKTAP